MNDAIFVVYISCNWLVKTDVKLSCEGLDLSIKYQIFGPN